MNDAATGLAGAATRGVFWSAAGGALSKLVAAAGMLALARLLAREELGVAAYALTFASLFDVLRGFGTGQALIYFPSDERRTQTAFWIALANGLLLGALALALAPAVALFYRDPRAADVVRTMALYFPLLALGQVLDVQLRKDLRFGRRVGSELARSVARTAFAIGLAFAGFGYWSVIVSYLAGAAAWSAALWVLVPWRPRFVFDRAEAARLLGYGKHLVAVSVLVVIGMQADHLAVGRFFGPEALGVYAIAFAVPALFLQACAGLSQVLFPAYARLDGDPERLRSAALRTLRLAAALFVPAGVGLALVAEPLILGVFGREWRDAVPVLRWMCAWVVTTSLTYHLGDVYKAIGEARILAWLAAGTTVLLVPGMVWAGVRGGGLVAVVAVLIAVRMVRLALDLAVARKLIGLRPADALRNVWPALASAAAMAAVVLGVDRWVAGMPALPRLVLLVAAGAGAHLATLAAVDRGLYREIRDLARAALGSGPSAADGARSHRSSKT